jgi:hypothetical protein
VLVCLQRLWSSAHPQLWWPYLDSQSTLCASTWLVQQLLRPWLYNRSVDCEIDLSIMKGNPACATAPLQYHLISMRYNTVHNHVMMTAVWRVVVAIQAAWVLSLVSCHPCSALHTPLGGYFSSSWCKVSLLDPWCEAVLAEPLWL